MAASNGLLPMLKKMGSKIRPKYIKSLLYNPATPLPVMCCLIIAEIAVNMFVIQKIKCK